jgi:hypothetical protein
VLWPFFGIESASSLEQAHLPNAPFWSKFDDGGAVLGEGLLSGLPTTQDKFPILKEDSPLRHQNQPPDGSRPLMRR